MPRLVRRAPLSERIMAYCNVMDFLLWLSEELETRDWDSKQVGTQVGLAASFVFMIARANSEGATDADQELFGDGSGSTGWAHYIAATTVWILLPFSVLNALYALNRTRQYRLFEADVEKGPQTPSARRVKVQSTPVAASPIRFISNLLSSATADSRSHPDNKRDVWELSVWDPLPMSLRLLCIFSPGHVLLYMMFLPLAQLDEKPSVTLAKCLLLQVVMSVQMIVMTSQYAQLLKDSAIIQKEVMNEYDTKFVRPRLHPVVRDAGVQVNITRSAGIRDTVEVGTPTTLINRGFQTRPNPNYVSHVDPDGSPAPSTKPRTFRSTATGPFTAVTPSAFAATPNYRTRTSMAAVAASPAPSRPINASTGVGTGTNFGGSMGVYTHQKSPLKKALHILDDVPVSPRNSREMAAMEQRARQSSPVKETRRLASNGFPKSRYAERYPSRV